MKEILTKFKGPILLFITAFFWGTTFVAQALGSDYVGAFTYNAGRFITTGIILSIYIIIKTLITKEKPKVDTSKFSKKTIYIVAVLIGVSLFIGANLQQIGINLTKSPAKSGFVSTTYIIFVPLLGLFFKKKIRPIIWTLLIVALTGSYLISINGDFKIELGDLLTLLCAIAFAMQIVLIDIISPYIDSIFLTAIEFLVSGILSIIVMFFFEEVTLSNLINAAPAILYAAIFSGCIAYTCQIIGQKYTEATVASLIMSLESVIALISGVLVMQEVITLKVGIGCLLIFIATILAQVNFEKLFKNKKSICN